MFGHEGGYMYGFGMWFFWLFVLVVVVLFLRGLGGGSSTTTIERDKSARDILNERYARGDHDE